MSVKEKLSRGAYVEAQIFHLAGNQGTLIQATRSVEERYGLKHESLGNGYFFETRTLALLYMLIVVPKELWSLSEKHKIYDQIDDLWSVSQVNIISDNSQWQNPTYKFIHHLRNAIAHANFQFENQNLRFWDGRGENISFEARISKDTLINFLEVVGAHMANYSNV